MNERAQTPDDLTRTWRESVAVKITAVVLYAVVLVASLLAAFFLWNADERMERDYAERADRLAYLTAVDASGLTAEELRTKVAPLLHEFGFSAVDIRIGNETARTGDPGKGATALLRTLPAGVGVISSLTLYHAPLHEAVRSRRNMIFIATGASALVFGLFLTWVILKFITRPVQDLVAATQAATAGNLGVRLETAREDEFGALARFFNGLLERIQEELAERNRAEARLQRSNEFIKTALDSMNDAIAVIDARDFTIRGVNSRFLAEYHVREEDVIGKTCFDVTHHRLSPCGPPDDVCPLHETIAGGGHAAAEHVHYEQDGSKIYVEVSTSPILDEHGRVVQVVHVSRDITERKKAEELLRKNKEQIANILDSIHAGVVLIEPRRHEIVYVNSFAAAMIGAPKERIIGRVCHHFVCPAERGSCPITDRGEVVDNAERVLLRADGSRIPILKSAVRTRFNGDEHIIESFIDVSAIKKTESDLREAGEELQAFVYSASHDMRQPLVNIKGFTAEIFHAFREVQSVLERNSALLPEQDRSRIATVFQDDIQAASGFIGASVDRMSSIIDALLHLAWLGSRKLRLENVDIASVARTVVKKLEGGQGKVAASVTVADLPRSATDREAIEWILESLLDNALKYRAEGRPSVVSVAGERVNGEVVIHVRDNGRGIDADDQAKLFKIFRRLGEQDVPGEGVGLASARALVRRLGGRIWCTSEPGTGSVFSFALPDRYVAASAEP